MNKDYWDEIYRINTIQDEPSDFASYCLKKFFSPNQVLVDLGAGNYRDTLFFLSNQLNVIAIDQSLPELNSSLANDKIKDLMSSNCQAIKSDFCNFDFKNLKEIDIYYARWSLHSITLKDEEKLFQNISHNFKKNNLFCIEARSTKDQLFGSGKPLEKNAFFTDHYRRFVDIEELKETINKYNFKILYLEESDNFSKTFNENPILIRAVLS